jgi:DNA-binding NarL/FixJ family response regulator
MDVAMPHMDGVEATARIHAELPGIRILGVSTLARNETADALEQAGATGFFIKGTDIRRLIDELLAFFGGRSQPVMAYLIETGKLTLEDVQQAEQTLQKLAKKDRSSRRSLWCRDGGPEGPHYLLLCSLISPALR